MDLERTLVLVKPDGVQRGLVGTIIVKFEATGDEDRWDEAHACQ